MTGNRKPPDSPQLSSLRDRDRKRNGLSNGSMPKRPRVLFDGFVTNFRVSRLCLRRRSRELPQGIPAHAGPRLSAAVNDLGAFHVEVKVNSAWGDSVLVLISLFSLIGLRVPGQRLNSFGKGTLRKYPDGILFREK